MFSYSFNSFQGFYAELVSSSPLSISKIRVMVVMDSLDLDSLFDCHWFTPLIFFRLAW